MEGRAAAPRRRHRAYGGRRAGLTAAGEGQASAPDGRAGPGVRAAAPAPLLPAAAPARTPPPIGPGPLSAAGPGALRR